MYNNTVYVVGQSKTNTDNAITRQFNSFFIGFIICIETDEIVDLSCTHTISTTEIFLKQFFIGKKCLAELNTLERDIKKYYHGSSQKAIIVSCKEAFRQYKEIKQKYF
jgi:hypothetical protein